MEREQLGGTRAPSVVLIGGPGAIRTRDTRFRRAVLYPLSYEASDHECTGAPTRAATTFHRRVA